MKEFPHKSRETSLQYLLCVEKRSIKFLGDTKGGGGPKGGWGGCSGGRDGEAGHGCPTNELIKNISFFSKGKKKMAVE